MSMVRCDKDPYGNNKFDVPVAAAVKDACALSTVQ